jgi:hypothetical protein
MKMPRLALHAISLRQEFKTRYRNEANYCGLCGKNECASRGSARKSSNHQHPEKRQAPIFNQIADGAFWSLAD